MDRRALLKTRRIFSLLSAAAVALLGVLDFRLGHQIAFAVFYLPPVLLGTWYGGRWYGGLLAWASALVWLLADLQNPERHGHPSIPYWNAAAMLLIFLVTGNLLRRLQFLLEKARSASRVDMLTGTANRRALFEALDAEIERARRYGGPLTVAYIDLDDFKKVNDRLGHEAGDVVLRVVAGILESSVRASDLVARVGGDEFVVLMPETDAAAGETTGSKLHELLSRAAHERRWPVGFSIGIATFTALPGTAQEALTRADDLMYEAKREGKNRIRKQVFGEAA